MERIMMQITRYDSLASMKQDEYRYWQQRPDHERIAAVSELTRHIYDLKNQNRKKNTKLNVQRLQRILVHIKR
jgi:hypothetical protein